MKHNLSRPQIREVFLRNGARIEPDRDDLPDWVYEAVFELLELVAPAVQGEPVAWMFADEMDRTKIVLGKETAESLCPSGEVTPLYTTPQPAEQQPSANDSLTPVPDELFAAEFSAWWEAHGQLCRSGGGDYERTFAFEAWRHLYPQLMNLQMVVAEQQPRSDAQIVEKTEQVAAILAERFHQRVMTGSATFRDSENPLARQCWDVACQIQEVLTDTDVENALAELEGDQPAEQQPAPDVAGLVEALESLLRHAKKLGRKSAVYDKARAALAAHRQQGGAI